MREAKLLSLSKIFRTYRIMDKQVYIDKANEIIALLGSYKDLKFSENPLAIDELIMDTELLLYKYDSNYPSLFEIKSIKERYSGRYWDYESVIIKTLSLILNKFEEFLSE